MKCKTLLALLLLSYPDTGLYARGARPRPRPIIPRPVIPEYRPPSEIKRPPSPLTTDQLRRFERGDYSIPKLGPKRRELFLVQQETRHILFDPPRREANSLTFPFPGLPFSLPFASIPVGYDGTVFVENVAHLRTARLAIKQAKATRALVVIKRTERAKENLRGLDEKPQAVHVIYDLPQSLNAAKEIHRIPVARAQLKEVFTARTKIKAAVAAARLTQRKVEETDLANTPGSDRMATRVQDRLTAADKNDLTLVIGHIVDGRIRFEDGSELALSEMPKIGQVWVLGCRTVWHKLDGEGLDFATGRAIRYLDAALAVEKILGNFTNSSSYRSMALDLQNLPPVSAPPVDRKRRNPSEELTLPVGYSVMLVENANVKVFQPYNEALA